MFACVFSCMFFVSLIRLSAVYLVPSALCLSVLMLCAVYTSLSLSVCWCLLKACLPFFCLLVLIFLSIYTRLISICCILCLLTIQYLRFFVAIVCTSLLLPVYLPVCCWCLFTAIVCFISAAFSCMPLCVSAYNSARLSALCPQFNLMWVCYLSACGLEDCLNFACHGFVLYRVCSNF